MRSLKNTVNPQKNAKKQLRFCDIVGVMVARGSMRIMHARFFNCPLREHLAAFLNTYKPSAQDFIPISPSAPSLSGAELLMSGALLDFPAPQEKHQAGCACQKQSYGGWFRNG